MIGLCYMLVYLLKRGQVDYSVVGFEDPMVALEHTRKIKKETTNKELCGPPGSPSWPLLELVDQVFALRFDEEPNYIKYRLILQEMIMDLDPRVSRVGQGMPSLVLKPKGHRRNAKDQD